MKSLRVPLNTSPEQAEKLRRLQSAFAAACNALAPLVQKTKVWNRVALHHMAYKQLREQFPDMGSQMVCNAIYSVSRHSRMCFQSPQSPFSLARLGNRPLPLLQFSDSAPVYFDRHTLSIKDGRLSMYTLDGRMRFAIDLRREDEAEFHAGRLREVVLRRAGGEHFQLEFMFADADDPETPAAPAQTSLPEYMIVEDANEAQ